MKKAILLSLTTIAALSMLPAPAQAKTVSKNIVISSANKKLSQKELKECLKKNGISINTIISGDCSNIVIPGFPGINKPENKPGNKPGNKPENNKPGKPENKPENNKPGKPETDKPEDNTSTSAYAAEVLKLVNQERAKAGLPALKLDKSVEKAANVRAEEIVSSFSHTRPNGTSFSTAIKESGAKFNGAGENIAWGQKTPKQVMDGWMNSEGHRANILNKKFTKIGVGYYQNAKGVNYWTQLFTY